MNSNIQNTTVIILAGGKSQRAETIKGLRQVKNDYWLDIQIQFFKTIGIEQIYVGLGFDCSTYISKSKMLSDCEYVINPNPENGSFSTLQSVLTQALKTKNSILLIHVDHALPRLHTIKNLIEQSNYDVIKPCYQKKSGHPILLSYRLCKKLLIKPSSSQLNSEIHNLNIEQIAWVEVNDENILQNLNTQDKWQNYKNTLK